MKVEFNQNQFVKIVRNGIVFVNLTDLAARLDEDAACINNPDIKSGVAYCTNELRQLDLHQVKRWDIGSDKFNKTFKEPLFSHVNMQMVLEGFRELLQYREQGVHPDALHWLIDQVTKIQQECLQDN